jgi:hypothetical protein
MPPLYQQIIAASDRFGLNWNDTTILCIVLRYHEEATGQTLLEYVESVAAQEASCSDDSASSSDDSESE